MNHTGGNYARLNGGGGGGEEDMDRNERRRRSVREDVYGHEARRRGKKKTAGILSEEVYGVTVERRNFEKASVYTRREIFFTLINMPFWYGKKPTTKHAGKHTTLVMEKWIHPAHTV